MQNETSFPERGINELFSELWSVYLARVVRLIVIALASAVVVYGVSAGVNALMPEGNQPAIDAILASVPEDGSPTNEQLQEVAELQLEDLPLVLFTASLLASVTLLVSAVAAVAYMFVIGAHHVVGRVLVSEALAFSLQRIGSLVVTTLMALAVVFAVWTALLIVPFMIANAAADIDLVAALFALLSFAGIVGAVVITIYVGVRWAFIWPVIAFEGLTGVAALRRSWELTENFWWRTFGIIIVVFLAALAVSFPGLIASGAGLEMVGTWYSNIIAPTLAGPIQAVMIFLLYADLRTRKETPTGYDNIAQELGFQFQTWDDAS